MKTKFWKRVAALLLVVVLAAGMLGISAGAADDSEETEIVRRSLPSYQLPWDITSEERTAFYQEVYDGLSGLIQKYPTDSSLYYLRAKFARAHSSDLEERADLDRILADYDQAIELEKQSAPHEKQFYTWVESYLGVDIGTDSSNVEASIYLNERPDQQGYLTAKQDELDFSQRALLKQLQMFGSDTYEMKKLYQIETQQKQLNEIKQWTQENAASFQAWDGRVQVTGGVGSTTFTMFLPQAHGEYTDDCFYTAFQCEMTFSAPIQNVVRSLDGLNISVPTESRCQQKLTYWLEDGTVVTETRNYPIWSESSVLGDLSEFSYSSISVPAYYTQKYPRQSFTELGDVQWTLYLNRPLDW